MSYRAFISDKNSIKQPYEYCEASLFGSFSFLIVSLNLKCLVPSLKISDYLRNELTGISFFAVLFCLFALIVCNLFREKTPIIKVKKMTLKNRIVSCLICRKFNYKVLIDVLGLEVKTRYGYEIPIVKAYVNNDEGWLAIENLGNNKLNSNHVVSDLSGILTGRLLQKYSFVSSELSRDGNFYIFYFEDMITSHRFFVRNGNINPFLSENRHHLRLANDLIWYCDLTPNLSVIARTRAGKSIFVGEFLIPLMIKQGWQIEYYSVKNDIYVRKLSGEFDPKKIILALEHWVKVMNKRERLITQLGKSKYTEAKDLTDIGLVIDEISNFNNYILDDKKLRLRWEKAINLLTAKGGSSGIHVIALSQMGTKEAFLPSKARTNCSDAVIMLGLAADSGDDRKYLMAGFDVPHRNYKAGQGLARFVNSGKKWEKPHFYETPWIC